MSNSIFNRGSGNLLPFGVVIDGDVSVFVDRLYRPIIVCPGKWPRCDLSLATVADGPAMYGRKLAHRFYHEHSQPVADPAVRVRLKSLVDSCAVLRAELRRRALMAQSDPPPDMAREGADLIRHTFGNQQEMRA